jgi:hypothetical protein
MRSEERALIVESCGLCGREQTVIRGKDGGVIPVCICCGGGGLERDRYCRHHGLQRELPLSPPIVLE